MSQTPAQAREVDDKLLCAWHGHPRHYILDNADKTFEQKMEQVHPTPPLPTHEIHTYPPCAHPAHPY